MTQDITADFVYMRLHGDEELYRSGYSDASLDRWAKRISAWQKGAEPADAQKVSPQKPPTREPRDIYCFFDNTDVKLRAPFDAQTLMGKLGIAPRGESSREVAAPVKRLRRRTAEPSTNEGAPRKVSSKKKRGANGRSNRSTDSVAKTPARRSSSGAGRAKKRAAP
jgi:hypothetical protein